jgi:hypothetical protein
VLRVAPTLIVVGLVPRCVGSAQPPTFTTGGNEKRDEQVAPRETLSPPPPPQLVKRVTLPDEVVVRALSTGQLGFLRCFKKANENDPTLGRVKVTLHVEIDPDGTITAATGNAEDPGFNNCLLRIARLLPFPPPGQPAAVDLPLFFGSG